MSNAARSNRAKGKNSFLLYDDFAEILKDLTDEEAGIIFRKIYEYRMFLKDPEHQAEPEEPKDRLLRMVLSPIKCNLKRDWESYIEACERKKNNRPEDQEPEDEESG